MKKIIFILLLGILLLGYTVWFIANQPDKPVVRKQIQKPYTDVPTFWKRQCIDTMKTSRDKARQWASRKDLENLIDKEMSAIKDMGANCVALDTPYDSEFLPVLKKWVASARKHNLNIWFRGNFSQWEGWFDYKGELTEQQHLDKTSDFIIKNSEIFKDGDLFTASPEAENGGPFDQVEVDEYPRFRKYLIDEYNTSTQAFKKINKNVQVNWLSMNGGLAKRMLDQTTVDQIGKLVSLDHYIKTAPEMGEYIQYFKLAFNAKVSIGEFGAPIPEINGKMSESEQANFIEQLFKELYVNKDQVDGVNYWTLYDGSTRLLNDDYSPRETVNIIKKYYRPGVIYGQVTNDRGRIFNNLKISVTELNQEFSTDSKGIYSILLPEGEYTLKFIFTKDQTITKKIVIKYNSQQQFDIQLQTAPLTFIQKALRLIKKD